MTALHAFFAWPNGGIWSNLIASFLWVAPTYAILWRKRVCRVPWCHRWGKHQVAGTTWKVCDRHHEADRHFNLHVHFKAKHPKRLAAGESRATRRGR